MRFWSYFAAQEFKDEDDQKQRKEDDEERRKEETGQEEVTAVDDVDKEKEVEDEEEKELAEHGEEEREAEDKDKDKEQDEEDEEEDEEKEDVSERKIKPVISDVSGEMFHLASIVMYTSFSRLPVCVLNKCRDDRPWQSKVENKNKRKTKLNTQWLYLRYPVVLYWNPNRPWTWAFHKL